MKGLLLMSWILFTTVQGGFGRNHRLSTDLCHPCGGSTRVTRPVMRRQTNISTIDICQHISSLELKVVDIKYNAEIKLYQIVNDRFDGDVAYLERAYLRRQPRECSLGPVVSVTSAGMSRMVSMYNRLVNLHLVVNFTESHHLNHRCSVIISDMSDDLVQAMCDLHFMIRGSSQTEGFDTVCQKEECFHLRRGCVSFQKHSYMTLRYVADVLDTVSQESDLLKQEWGC